MHQSVSAASSRERYAKPLFLATIVTGSFLLFLTQPMVARMALPRLGGAPAVWNSAMLVYQALLLGGYAYAHWLSRLAPRTQAGLHLAMFAIAALWLPIGLAGAVPSAGTTPTFWVPWLLVASIGPLFFIISAQAPLMQRWYALETARGEPYALYAASNLGSFAGLISYPLFVEPLLTLEEQSRVWTGGFLLLVLLVAGCALTIPRRPREAAPEERSPAPARPRIALWIALAAVPSGLMLSTTTHLTTDIVAMPLLWALPLGLYLLSFAIAFANRRAAAVFITQVAPLVILIAGGLAFASGTQRPLFSATLGLSLLFFVAVTLHAEMYRLRPPADRLTGFYLAMSVGGVLGGAFCAIVAPTLFDWAYEHPLLILAAALLIPQRNYLAAVERVWADPAWRRRLSLWLPVIALLLSLVGDRRFHSDVPPMLAYAAIAAIGLMALFSLGRRWVFAACLAALMMSHGGWGTLKLSWHDVRTRSYFGIYTVASTPERDAVSLTHGTTLHGLQNSEPDRRLEPTSYYVRESGVGRAFTLAPRLFGPDARIGVVGLGTGTLACYARPGQDWRFFEIDPAVVSIARDSGYFTFLRECAPDADIILGDARLTLAGQRAGALDLLAVDAFSSDSVPMHLLTREAFGVYGRALQPRGILLVHISNRYLDLEPVVAAAARSGGWTAAMLRYQPGEEAEAGNATASVWVAMSRSSDSLDDMIFANSMVSIWETLEPRPGFAGWTDDYASILPLIEGWTE
ncbi:spermidine synthase [Enterovirga sp. GCM10030262]|uniref:spermidine synthase n=1 Tax=Enterovirga sp. GCM10030262 TaxID=3273391 RepID=UPI0036206EB9